MRGRSHHGAVRCRPRQFEREAAHLRKVFIVRAGIDVQRLHRAIIVAGACIVTTADVETHHFQFFLHIHDNPIRKSGRIATVLAVPERRAVLGKQAGIAASVARLHAVARGCPRSPVVLDGGLSLTHLQHDEGSDPIAVAHLHRSRALRTGVVGLGGRHEDVLAGHRRRAPFAVRIAEVNVFHHDARRNVRICRHGSRRAAGSRQNAAPLNLHIARIGLLRLATSPKDKCQEH